MTVWRAWATAAALAVLPVHLAAAEEPVSTTTPLESALSTSTVHEVVVPASSGDVWKAISTADGWRTWAAPMARSDVSDPTIIETSYDPEAQRGSAQTIVQRIILKVPERILAFRTIKAPAGFRNFDALAQVSWVFELIPEGSGRTRVRLTGTGYPRTQAGEEVRGFFERGNVISMDSLRQRFAQGPIDWQAKLAAKAVQGK